MKHVRLALAASLAVVSIAAIGIVSAQDSNTANVEVRVWQSTRDAERLWISARPEGGSWAALGTIPLGMEEENSRGSLRYEDITLAVPLPDSAPPVAQPTPEPTPTPSDTQPVIHFDSRQGLGFFFADVYGGTVAWLAREGRDGTVVTAIEIYDGGYDGHQSKLRVTCIGGKLAVTFYPNDFLLVRNTLSFRDHDFFRGNVLFQIDQHASRSQRWQNLAQEGSLAPVLRSYNPESLLAEMRRADSIVFWGGQQTMPSGEFARRARVLSLRSLFGTPVQWNIDNCGSY